jgi:hypothetical protein
VSLTDLAKRIEEYEVGSELSSGVESLPSSPKLSPFPLAEKPYMTPAPALASSSSRATVAITANTRMRLLKPTPPRAIRPRAISSQRDLTQPALTKILSSRESPAISSQTPSLIQGTKSRNPLLLGAARTLRERPTQPDYVRHPMDKWKRDRSATKSEEIRKNVRGRSALPAEKMLAAGDGVRSGRAVKWPTKGIKSVKGTMVRSFA